MTDEQKPSGAEELLTNVATTIGSALGTVAAKVNEFSKVASAEARKRPRAKAKKKARPAKRSKRGTKPAKRAAKSASSKRPARKKSRR
jgi:hypothetical protein